VLLTTWVILSGLTGALALLGFHVRQYAHSTEVRRHVRPSVGVAAVATGLILIVVVGLRAYDLVPFNIREWTALLSVAVAAAALFAATWMARRLAREIPV
jgi:hypothetical protein